MDNKILTILENRKWLKMGRWQEPVAMETCVSSGIVGADNFYVITPFNPTFYLIVHHAQYIDEKEFEKGVAEVKNLFENDPLKTSSRLKKVIHKNSKKFLKFSRGSINLETAESIFEGMLHQGRQWFEIMLSDNALQELYKKSLPDTFVIAGKNYSSEKLLAKVALPKKLFPIIEERADLLKIAIEIKKGQDIKKIQSVTQRNMAG
jgi:hypothetical protein